ncbi:long-chain fatty acid--CoA ligase [Amycolatopsis acidiphila]|uniref:Long-chain fatty acid--CoA ligase n=1 Tax=Amycolatopsis acidiphila TaxID=715473 RepID=A0A558AJU6_9PSEU|nr:long-chain fatty acid--CoA ligase [Amycolatopsis acidiphila]TVT24538.1 long-chain fatty acid--CoA ligase [Amycolatopsis acidiphila]UIJ59250.1 long-chain fatty acid--CoA ligase [Amycolatopsis acidiphila]GHG79331.1 fatty-acyl-CoA synthase [Amycolatopsis acidiphila]
MLSTMQDGHLNIGTLLRHGSTVHANSEVITWTGGGSRRESFADLGKHAAKLAGALRGLGITGDQRVGTFMWNNAEHMAAYCAIPAMGAVLHTLNIRLFPEQLVFVANHAEDQVILVDGTLVPLLAKQLPQMKTVRHVVVANGDASTLQAPEGVEVHAYDELLAGQPDTFDWPEVDERAAAAMCYTSGTTGDPKGVAYSHRSIWLHSMQVCMTDSMKLAESDTALSIVPMFHAMAWGLPYASLMIGASLVLPDRFLQPAPIAELLAAEKPTFAGAVPTIWQGLLQHLDANPQDISHLREVVVGGSAAPPSLMHAFEERYGVSILHAWGMTETSPLGSVARPPKSAAGEQAWAYRYTQGRFPAGVAARLIGDSGEELPWDNEAVGELEVQGPWIAASYYGGDSVDPDKFHDGWLRTGDVGKVSPDGYLTLTDRSKDVIKSGGEWISSVDLENSVMGHPAVAEAAVIGVPDEKWDERPLVAVVVRQGEQVTADELREFLADKVAKWQLPEHWTFVEEVPKTSVGKFDKKRLRAMNSEGELDVTHF